MSFIKKLAVLILSCLFVGNSSYAKTTKQAPQKTKHIEEAPERKQCMEGNYEVCSRMYQAFLNDELKVSPIYCPITTGDEHFRYIRGNIIATSDSNSDEWIDCIVDYGLRTCNSSDVKKNCANAAFRSLKTIIRRTDSDIRIYSVSELLPNVHSLLTSSCKLNNEVSCFSLGLIYDLFWVSPFKKNLDGIYEYRRDYFKDYKYIKDLTYTSRNNNKGFQLDLVHSRLEDYKFTQDFFKAFDLYKKSCDLDYAKACINLGSMLEKGDGTKRDLKQAYSYYEKACKLEDGYGCKMQGLALEHGVGTNKDIAKATELYGKACDMKDQEGCDLYNKQTDYKPL